jgi:hypothetical protein
MRPDSHSLTAPLREDRDDVVVTQREPWVAGSTATGSVNLHACRRLSSKDRETTVRYEIESGFGIDTRPILRLKSDRKFSGFPERSR